MKLTRIGKTSASIVSFDEQGIDILVSYETPVAFYSWKERVAYVTTKKWSVTTSKHINQFLKSLHLNRSLACDVSQEMLNTMFKAVVSGTK